MSYFRGSEVVALGVYSQDHYKNAKDAASSGAIYKLSNDIAEHEAMLQRDFLDATEVGAECVDGNHSTCHAVVTRASQQWEDLSDYCDLTDEV